MAKTQPASEDHSNRGNLFRRLWQFVSRQAVDDVPEDVALCEYDCRRGQCMQDEWATCERRSRKGSGELFPAKKPGSSAGRYLPVRESLRTRIGGYLPHRSGD